MKAATGEATLTVITIAAIALIIAVFMIFWGNQEEKISEWNPTDTIKNKK
jgi:hypothetical protein